MKLNLQTFQATLRCGIYLLAGNTLIACANQSVVPTASPALVPASSVAKNGTDNDITATGLITPSTLPPPINDLAGPAVSEAVEDKPDDTIIDKVTDIEHSAERNRHIAAPTSSEDSISVIKWRAERGHTESQLALGQAYLQGTKVATDFAQARLWLELASMKGSSVAQLELGSLYYSGSGVRKDYLNAREWWLEAAANGNAIAQQKLGYMYSEGIGVERDFVRAKNWYIQAANRGNTHAQTLLGSLYHEGNRIPQNYEEAIKWYGLAAQGGHPHAQYTLATLYHDGLGTETDYVKCAAWVEVAVANGYPDELDAGNLCRNYLEEPAQFEADELVRQWKKTSLTQSPAIN